MKFEKKKSMWSYYLEKTFCSLSAYLFNVIMDRKI